MNTEGTFGIPISEEEAQAFNALCVGLRDGRDKSELSPLIEMVQAVQDRAFASPEGKEYLKNHSIRVQAMAGHLEKLDHQTCSSSGRSF